MSRPTSVLLLASWLVAPGLALAQELTPEKIAVIRREEQAAQAKVNAAYGNRKPSEMTSDERRQAIQDQQEAVGAVLEKHGVSDKDYARHVARMGLEERQAVAVAEKRLEEEEKAAREAALKKPEGPEEIPIQQGISDANPVELEATEDAPTVVEQGLPPGEEGQEPTEGATEEATGAPVEVPVE